MGAVRTLIGFGIGLLGFGFYWKLQDDVITHLFSKYIFNTGGEYYLATDLIWNALPIIVMLLGIVCIIMGGLSYHKGSTEVD